MTETRTLLEYLRPVLNGSRRDVTLAAMRYLAENAQAGKLTSSDLKAALITARVPQARKFNVADVLAKAGALVSAEKSESALLWSLTQSGRDFVSARLGEEIEIPEAVNATRGLEKLARSVSDDVVRGYIGEALTCYQVDARRAAVVFLWSGAIRHLQEKALTHGTQNLNAALAKHDPRAKAVSKIEDFSAIKDVSQLLGFRELGMIDKGEWQTLQEGLDLRNRCGHPTKYRPGASKVAGFIEDIISIAF